MIPLFKVRMPESAVEPLRKTLLSGYIGQGPRVDEFEAQLAPWLGSKNIVTVSSGTSALFLALKLATIGPGAEVISSPQTCSATNMAILQAGAEIVWADINPWTGNLDPEDVARKVTHRTKAIMAVHWGGYPCDLDELNGIALRHGIDVIEDAAHGFGADYRGRRVGSISRFTCFSFQAIKHLTTGDGGALACRDEDDAKRAKLLRWFGIDRNGPKTDDLRCEADIAEPGFKLQMNDIAATIGLDNLKGVGDALAAHRDNAKFYESAILAAGPRRVKLLRYQGDRLSSYWLFTILVDDRDGFRAHMERAGIMTSKVHARNDVHSCFARFHAALPGVDEFSRRQVSIPVGWWVTTEERIHIIEQALQW